MKVYLKQKWEDIIAEAFIHGVIEKDVYFELLDELEKDKKLFEVWKN